MTKKVLLLKIAVVAFAAVLLAAGMLGCNAASSSEYPDTLDSYVYDGVGVLREETVEHINSVGSNLSQQTGGEIVVACVNTTGYTDIADYAYEMFNQWKIGDSEKNNGVLLLLSIDEDDYWCLQGEGLEKTLSSGQISLILDDYLEPYFAEKDYDSGVLATFDALVDKFEAAYSVTITSDNNSSNSASSADDFYFDDYYDYYYSYTFTGIIGDIIVMGIIIVVIALIVFIAIISPRRRRRRGIFDVPPPPRHHHNPPPPHHGGFGGHIGGGPRPGGYRPGGFSGGSRPGGMGGSRPGGFSSGHSGGRPGGGMSRGGGAGRR